MLSARFGMPSGPIQRISCEDIAGLEAIVPRSCANTSLRPSPSRCGVHLVAARAHLERIPPTRTCASFMSAVTYLASLTSGVRITSLPGRCVLSVEGSLTRLCVTSCHP